MTCQHEHRSVVFTRPLSCSTFNRGSGRGGKVESGLSALCQIQQPPPVTKKLDLQSKTISIIYGFQ